MIRFENVTKIYEDTGRQIFSHADYHIARGELVLLTGESGAGKSTFLRMVMRDTDITEGEIYVEGRGISKVSRRKLPGYRRKIGMMFQDLRLIPDMTVVENVELAGLAVNGSAGQARKRCAYLFSMLGISGMYNRYPDELSGGQAARAALARALMNNPVILLADEPTGNLDEKNSVELMKLFSLIRDQGITVVVATHDIKNAEGIAFREIHIKKPRDDAGADNGDITDSN